MDRNTLTTNTLMRKYFVCAFESEIVVFHFCFVSYYFDDGKIASESLKIVETREVYEGAFQYKVIGNGYFRISHDEYVYVIQYDVSNAILNGNVSE